MSSRYLIAGASSGIGAALTSRLLSENAEIVAVNRSEGGVADVELHVCDVTDSSIELPVVEGDLNGLVYMPGTINLKPFQNLTEDDFRHEWEVNFLGAVRVIKKYISNLKQAKDSSIVLVSTVAVGQGMPFHASTASAKGAVEALGRSLAAELAPKIRVNIVAPSLTSTSLAENLIKDEKRREAACNRHPLNRIGSPEDVAEAIFFLLTQRSSWVTGQVLHVDGGLSSLKLL